MSAIYDSSSSSLESIRRRVEELHERLALSALQDPLDGGGYRHVSAAEISVEAFDLILLWPLRIKDGTRPNDADAPGSWQSPEKQLADWTRRITNDGQGPWCERTEAFPHTAAGERAEREFSELAYFHPFVRNFLYVSRDDMRADSKQNRNLRILQRTDVAEINLSFLLGNPDKHIESCKLAVDRVELYLFDTGIALLTVRATWAEGQPRPSLEKILKMQDVVRRLYAPYWSESNGFHAAGHCPDALSITIGGEEIQAYFGGYRTSGADASDDSNQRRAVGEQLEHIAKHREPLPVAPWLALLEPIKPVTTDKAPSDGLQFVQIEDERLQTFSYIGVPNPRQIHPGDWVRLASVDDPGTSSCFPYAPGFIRREGFEQFAYDRFWDPSGQPPATDYLTQTRWLCCGYGFTGVGSSQDPYFFADRHAGAHAHFHHHYFHLGLIAHFHRASLLNFKYRLTGVIDDWRRKAAQSGAQQAQGVFADKLDAVQRDFLLFRNMYWCTEVSNQAQGRELFDLWSLHLNTRPLFDQVNAELREATELVSGWRQQWLVKEQIEMHRNLEWVELFIVAAYAIEAMAAVGHLLHEEKTVSAWVLGILAILAGFFTYRILKLDKHEDRHGDNRSERRSRYGWLALLALLPLGFGLFYSCEHKSHSAKPPAVQPGVEHHEDDQPPPATGQGEQHDQQPSPTKESTNELPADG